MPFTAAHPAAVVPLYRWLHRWTVLSALAIGSITPDLSYVLPFRVMRTDSHSFAGLFWFCLPVGLATYLIFHLALKRPLVSLAPARYRNRLGSFVSGSRSLPAAPWTVVLASLLLGAATHVLWDSFTHRGGLAVAVIDLLRVPLSAIGSYEVSVYRILQHGSTVVGLFLLLRWTGRWLKSAPVEPAPVVALAPSERLAVVAALVSIPVVWGLAVALYHLSGPVNETIVRRAIGRGVTSSLAAWATMLLAYSAWWYLWWSRSRTAGS